MSLAIRRVKGSATHFAASVEPTTGFVTRWSKDVGEAATVDKLLADRVLARVKGNQKAGTFTVVEHAGGASVNVAISVDEKLAVEIRRVEADNAKLRTEVAKLETEAKQREQHLRERQDLLDSYASLSDDLGKKLEAANAELAALKAEPKPEIAPAPAEPAPAQQPKAKATK